MQLAPLFFQKKRNKIKNPLLNIAIIHLTFFYITEKKIEGSLTVVFLNQNVCAALLSFLFFCLKAASLLKIWDRLGFEKNLTLEKKVFFMMILFLRNDT